MSFSLRFPGSVLLLPVLLLSGFASAAPLLRGTTQHGTVPATLDPTVRRARNVKVDLSLLRQSHEVLELPLFPDASFRARVERVVPTERDGFVWIGYLSGHEGRSRVLLSALGDVLVGNITTERGEVYQLRYLGGGVHSARQIDPSAFPDEAPPGEVSLENSLISPMGTSCTTDASSGIDVMVVYTAAARTGAGGTTAMEALIYLAVEETNLSYLNSLVTQRLRLVHMAEVSYAESGNIQLDRDRLRNPSDGYMDAVHSLRDTYGADVVSLITENGGGYCGIAYIMSPVATSFESYAFSVVARNCATGYYSYGHELGHIMSARHDWYVDPTNNSPYTYNHGHTYPTGGWRTVMAYNNRCTALGTSCTRLPYFSNPNVLYGGVAMGVPTSGAQPGYNALTLDSTAATVANFRCSSPNVNDVWIKDTWKDSGQEPDALTASQNMWESPYIWVRNSQDTNLLYQHMHENPEFGQDNYVYVKLQNGGNAASGDLRVYYANASTGLSWPGQWNLLASVPVSLAAHSSRVVEATWSNLPGIGHYCLLARWVSASDPMTYAETSDVNSNTRNNNNIAWRNVNIVNLHDQDVLAVDFVFRNIEPFPSPLRLSIRPPPEELEDSFIRHGRVTLRLNDTLFTAWEQGGRQGTGFEMLDERTLLLVDPTGAELTDIHLEKGLEDSVTLEFTRLPETPRDSFRLEAIQWSEKEAMGGVSYELHTRPKEGSGGGGGGPDEPE